ncbi:DNA translocase FtsK [Heliophilum fasciatum]|uniref:DNA translocase FtsK n=1 Tax=Heliophilum fasciatum TaxID=35700 RepID=A0A4R2RZN0_9FIRM|nr:DNA translocase FtsK [Heliophilum fasciatum]MCW2277875.1 S-DNA-T family DNA segregation ATPase FtsK/SpoIIIE [Heliophilum fasciatum]TCP64555.1 DNA translocase FtsK [Heliophilum fasciatum]
MANMFNQLKKDLKYELIGLVFLVLALFSMISLLTFNTETMATASAGAGALGELVYRILSTMAGQGKFLLPVFLLYLGLKIMIEKAKLVITRQALGFLSAYLILLVFLQLILVSNDSDWEAGWDGQGGGLLGASIAILLKTVFGTIGTYIVLGAIVLAGILFVFELSLVDLVRKAVRFLHRHGGVSREKLREFLYTTVQEEEPLPQNSKEKRSRRTKFKESEALPTMPVQEEPIDTVADENDLPFIFIEHTDNDVPQWLQGQDEPEPIPVQEREQRYAQPVSTVAGAWKDDTLVQSLGAVAPVASPTPAPSLTSAAAVSRLASSVTDESYELPPLSLLHRVMRTKSPRLSQDITENVHILEETLESFGVKVKVAQVSRGPAITRYEVQPAPGVKVSRITGLADDIALSLAAGAVRIEAPVPGKSVVGIEVPNKEIMAVTFREVLEGPEFQQAASKLTIALGKDIAGTPIVAELAKMPHLLIAGATGAGKSVCMNSLICSILFKAKPSEVKFLMVDPKMVELTQYNGIPHLIAPVVTDAKKASTALKWIVSEMENRYELFASTGVKDITRYNQMKQRENPDLMQPAMPYVVVLIDELADLMMVAAADVEDAICRLAQMARAAGIHLVVATQRPSVDVITGLIKANIPSRIAFAVSSQTDSRTILDQAGAEKLLGRGDMLFSPVGTNKPMRVQGCYVSDQEVEDLVDYLKNQGIPEYQEGILKEQERVETAESADDPLFVDAVRVLLDSGQASISMLQRRLRVGYARAARLVDIMEQRGIVGGYEGSKPRELLITAAQFEARYGKTQSQDE